VEGRQPDAEIFAETIMPAKVHRCAKALQRKGKSESSSWAICNAVQKKKGSRKKKKGKR
jgi:hypothetical protein